jgi:heme exporter protein B
VPLALVAVALRLRPLAVGREAPRRRVFARGAVWVAALLAALLSVTQLYAGDLADGSLEQMLLVPGGRIAIVAAKAVSHWLLTGLPLAIAAPVFGLVFDLSPEGIRALVASLLLGTPVLSLMGGLGAALTLGLRSGAVLLILIIVPLCIPALIFGAGAVAAVDAGQSARGHYSLLGAVLIFTGVLAPVATAAALRIATE